MHLKPKGSRREKERGSKAIFPIADVGPTGKMDPAVQKQFPNQEKHNPE